MRRIGSLIVLLALVIGPPLLLPWLGFYAWAGLNVWAPADFRILLAALTVAGWLGWGIFALSAIVEGVRIATSGRIAIRLPGMAAPQAFAGVLLAAALAGSTGPAVLAVVSAGPAVGVAGSVAAPAKAAAQRADRAPASKPPAAAPRTASATVGAHAQVHVVSAGDDLWSLAERYYGHGGDWRKIVAANPDVLAADPTTDLAPGTALAIINAQPSAPEPQTPLSTTKPAVEPGSAAPSGAPASSVAVETAAASPAPSVSSPAPAPSVSAASPAPSASGTPDAKDPAAEPHPAPTQDYEVARGDTLWDLAEERLGDGARYPELQKLNAELIADPDHIETGWDLRLPVAPGEAARAKAAADTPQAADPSSSAAPAGPDAPAAPAAPGARPATTAPAPAAPRPATTPAPGSSAAKAPQPGVSIPGAPAATRGTGSIAPASAAPAAPVGASDAASPTAQQPAATQPTAATPGGSTEPGTTVPDGGLATFRADAVNSPLLRLAVGGLGVLAAVGVVAAVRARRREREASRGLGRTFPRVGNDLERLETALGLTATDPGFGDQQPSRGAVPAEGIAAATDDAAADSTPLTALVAKGMRILGTAWRAAGATPRLARAVLTAEGWELHLSDAPGSVPAPFDAGGDPLHLVATWSALEGAPEVAGPVAYPGLVTLGQDASGRPVMVDAVRWGVLAIDGDAPGLADLSLSALTLELGCSPWADELDLCVVTRQPEFVTAAATTPVRVLATAAEAVRDLEKRARERRALLTLADEDFDAARLDPDRADAWLPTVYLFEQPLDAAALTRLRAAADGRVGVSALVPGSGAALRSDPEAARLVLSRRVPDAEPRGVLLPAGLDVAAQTLEPQARDAIVRLLTSARSSETLPAAWWREDAVTGARGASARSPETPDDPDPRLTAPVDVPTARSDWTAQVVTLKPRGAASWETVAADEPRPPTHEGPRLTLFGPVTLDGAAGEPPAKARRRCLEYLGWLLEHPGATASEMSAALFVTDGTRRSNMSRLRAWLGFDPAGERYLPDAYSGRIEVFGVTSDWVQLQELLLDGVNRAGSARLRLALDLVTGAPLADAAPGEWAWADDLRRRMRELVRDASVVLARRERARGDLDAARAACRRGLLVASDDELLACERMQIEAASGDSDAVARILAEAQRVAEDVGVDLRPETVALAQELLEGGSRPVLRIGSNG